MVLFTVTLSIRCPLCGTEHFVNVREYDFELWGRGLNAQDAFPYLDATEREQMISQLCPACQEAVFGADEDF